MTTLSISTKKTAEQSETTRQPSPLAISFLSYLVYMADKFPKTVSDDEDDGSERNGLIM